jgi:hypothetical protein
MSQTRILLPDRSVVTPQTEQEIFAGQMEAARTAMFISGIHKFAKEVFDVSVKMGRSLGSGQVATAIKAQVDALVDTEVKDPIMPDEVSVKNDGLIPEFSLQEHYAAWMLINLLDWAHERKLRIAGCALALHHQDVDNLTKIEEQQRKEDQNAEVFEP